MFEVVHKEVEKRDGTIYEISTLGTSVNVLFVEFRKEYVRYNYKSYLNSAG